jgi:hypothetical protein
MKFVPLLPPPPHAVSASAPALASIDLQMCRIVMALLPEWLAETRRIGSADVR